MRTTVNLPDSLMVEAKRIAAERHISLTRVLEESLRRYLADERASQRRQKTPEPLPVFTDVKLVEDIDIDDTSSLWSHDDHL